MSDDLLRETQQRMAKSLDALQRELASIRTGRASPALIEHLQVEVYGSHMPLNQVASISAPEAHLILIQPWDHSNIAAIERAMQRSDLGLNPGNDGQVIRLPVPPLNEERRRELDEAQRAQALLQKVTDRFTEEIEEVARRKEAELLEV